MPGASADKNTYHRPNSLPFLYQRHRSHIQNLENLNLRPVPASHDSARKDLYGGENINLHRIYPREMYVCAVCIYHYPFV
jgi:hypothetical protein